MRAWLAALTLALLVAGAHARTEQRQAVEPDAGYAVGNGPHDLFRLPAGYAENLVVVEDTPSSSADNILELSGRDPARARVEADTGGELNLYWADQRAGVIIRDEFLSVPGHRLGVQRIRFDGDLTWTQGELAHRLGVDRRKLALTPAETARADPMTTARFALGHGVADTFRMHASDNNLTVLEIASGPHPRNQIVFDPPLDSKTAELFDDHGDVTVSWYGSAAARLTIRGALESHSGSRYGLQRLRFADGVTWTDRDLSSRLRSPAPARDVARGWIYGGTGPERLDTRGLAHGVIGRGGGDVIVYRRGYGDLDIDEADRSLHPHNRIALGPGIAPANVSVRREGDQLLLDVGGGAAMPRSVITLRGEFAHPTNVTRGIQDLSFADGERWNYAALVARIARTSPHNQHPEGDDGPNVFHLTADTVDVDGHGGGDSFLLESKASGPRIKEADRESFPVARSHANVLIVSLGGLGLPPGGGRNYVAQAARWRATRQARFPWLYVDVPVGENPLYAFAAARGSTVEARIAGGSVNNAPLIGVDTQGLITRAACVSGRSAYEIAECLGIATLTPRAVRSTLGSGKRNACLSLTRASRARVECIGVALVLLAGAAYALLKLGRRR